MMDRRATFATVHWVGWWTDLSRKTSRWTRPPVMSEAAHFQNSLERLIALTPGGMICPLYEKLSLMPRSQATPTQMWVYHIFVSVIIYVFAFYKFKVIM